MQEALGSDAWGLPTLDAMRRILHDLGEGLIDLANLFLGDPERDGEPRRTVGDAALRLGVLLGGSALILWIASLF